MLLNGQRIVGSLLLPAMRWLLERSPRARRLAIEIAAEKNEGYETFARTISADGGQNVLEYYIANNRELRQFATRQALSQRDDFSSLREAILTQPGLGELFHLLNDGRCISLICANRKLLRKIIRSRFGRNDVIDEILQFHPVAKKVTERFEGTQGVTLQSSGR